MDENKFVAEMTLVELIAVATTHRDLDLQCGITREASDRMTKRWINDLQRYQQLPPPKADALLRYLFPDET